MEKGKATGPQRRSRRTAEPPPEASEEGEEEAVIAGGDTAKARRAWDALTRRFRLALAGVQDVLASLPVGREVRKVEDLPMARMRALEEELSALRVRLSQAADSVQ